MSDPTDPTYSTDPADLAEPMDPIEDLPEPLPTVPDEERFIEDPATFDPSDEDIRDAAAETGDLPPISDELADCDAARQLRTVEPGAEGPLGSGVEGADDFLVESTDDAGEIRDASGSASDVATICSPPRSRATA